MLSGPAYAASLVSGKLQVMPNTLNSTIVRKTNELVTMGVPLAGCKVVDPAAFRLFDQTRTEVPVFVKATLYWPAGRNGCATRSVRALKVQFAYDATRGSAIYTWDLGGRVTSRDRPEAVVSEVVTNNPAKAGREEPRVFAILDPAYLVETGIAPPSAPQTLDVYDAAFFPLTWQRNSGSFVYNGSLAADWLFDRVSTNYRQAMRSGELAYWREAYLSHEWYISKMEVTGKNTNSPNYCLGGFDYQGKADTYGSGGAGCDTKYIYLEAYKLHLALTGDDSWQPRENGTPAAAMATREQVWKTIAQLLVTGSVRGGSVANQPAIPAPGFIKPYNRVDIAMTERDLGFGLQNVVNACELTLDATVCNWADTIVANIRQMQVANPDGIRQYGYLSHSLFKHEGDIYPWIGTAAVKHSASKSLRVNNVLGNGYQKLTKGETIRVGSTKVKLAGNATRNSDNSWTIPLGSAVTAGAGTRVTAVLKSNGDYDLDHETDRIFSPWMQAIAADGVWQYYNWTNEAADRNTASAILLGFARAYAAYALDGTRLSAGTRGKVEAAFDDYGPLKIFNSDITLITCASVSSIPYTRYFANALMGTPAMNRQYSTFVFENGGYANEHIPEGIFQLALGLLFERDAGKKAAMEAALTDLRNWYKGYSCSGNLTQNKRLYNWENKADPFGTYAYVQKLTSGIDFGLGVNLGGIIGVDIDIDSNVDVRR